MRRATCFLLSCCVSLLLGLGSVRADIVIEGDDAYTQAVNDCLSSINGVGGMPADILKCLESSGNDHVIKKNKGSSSNTPNNTNDANSPAAGGTGNGTGSTTQWDPSHQMTYSDGVKRDPCAALFHELVHAKDADTGMRDPRTNLPGNNGIKANEVKATGTENKYRKEKGLPLRKKYGDKDLPASAIPTAIEHEHEEDGSYEN
jgi:hypothetical protein